MAESSSGQRRVYFVRLVVVVLVAGSTGAALSRPADRSFARKGRGRSVAYVENKDYQAECSPCHLAFMPGFLPARSWQKIMGGLADHFGEDASLDEELTADIRKFLVKNAADAKSSTRRSKKIAKLIDPDETPIRITETAFWTRRHGSVRAWVWKRPSIQTKAKCSACHRDAEKGIYDEYDVEIPEN